MYVCDNILKSLIYKLILKIIVIKCTVIEDVTDMCSYEYLTF